MWGLRDVIGCSRFSRYTALDRLDICKATKDPPNKRDIPLSRSLFLSLTHPTSLSLVLSNGHSCDLRPSIRTSKDSRRVPQATRRSFDRRQAELGRRLQGRADVPRRLHEHRHGADRGVRQRPAQAPLRRDLHSRQQWCVSYRDLSIYLSIYLSIDLSIYLSIVI